MDWLQILFIALSNAAVVIPILIWIKTGQDEMRKDISSEMKDFHGRLCILEERYIQMMQEQQNVRTVIIQKALESRN